MKLCFILDMWMLQGDIRKVIRRTKVETLNEKTRKSIKMVINTPCRSGPKYNEKIKDHNVIHNVK